MRIPRSIEMNGGGRLRSVARGWRVELLLFAFVVVLVGPLIHEYGAQQASRYALSAAIWEEQTLQLDSYEGVLGIDRSERDGHIYSDKAPLQPFLGVPVYAIHKAVGGESAKTLRVVENLGVWWMTLWMSAIPLGLLAVVMYRFVNRYRPRALVPTLAFVVATMLLPFGAVLFGHVLAALFLFWSFSMISRDRPKPTAMMLAGAAAGAAVAVEYTSALGVVVLAGLVLLRARRRFGWFVLGGVPFVIALALYHWAAFGSPLTHPYQWSAFSGPVTEAAAPLSMFASINLERIPQVFFAGRGFLIATPLVVLGLYGLIRMLRSPQRQHRQTGWVAILMFVLYLGLVVLWGNPWGGESPGPRYMMPAIPFLVIGVAMAWDRSRLLSRAAWAVGAVTMGLATLTDPLFSRDIGGGLPQWIQLAAEGDIVPTVFTVAIGPIGWVIHLGLIVSIGWLLHREWSRGQDVSPAA